MKRGNLEDDLYWPALKTLIQKNGFMATCMGHYHDSGALQSCAFILGGYVIAEDGCIYSPDHIHRDFD
jgi:hypothetical protein